MSIAEELSQLFGVPNDSHQSTYPIIDDSVSLLFEYRWESLLSISGRFQFIDDYR